jgi:hypothetical protein
MFLQDPSIKGFNLPNTKKYKIIETKDILNIDDTKSKNSSKKNSQSNIFPLIVIAAVGGILLTRK